ncbi:MAG: hypothetical protein RRY99_13050, partial [Flavobacterium sp.]
MVINLFRYKLAKETYDTRPNKTTRTHLFKKTCTNNYKTMNYNALRKSVGVKPLLQGVFLCIFIAVLA